MAEQQHEKIDTVYVSSNLCELKGVYPPSEDSFALIDALEANLDDISKRSALLCVELCSGSGVVSASLAKALSRLRVNTQFICLDINKSACDVCLDVARQNGVCRLDCVISDLSDSVLRRLTRCVDLLLCNPPYVESSTEDLSSCTEASSAASCCSNETASADAVQSKNLMRACLGGEYGREIIDRVLLQAADLLSATGDLFLVTISRNDPQQVLKWAERNAGLKGHIALRRRAGIEELVVLRLKRATDELCNA